MSKEIYYSDKYEDDKYEYRHVMLPKVGISVYKNKPDNHTGQALAKLVPKTHCMSEQEWRNLGVQQSLGWVVQITLFKLHCLNYIVQITLFR